MKDPKITMETVRAASILLEECGREISPPHLTAAVLDAAKLESFQRQLRAVNERQCNGYTNGRGDWDQETEDRDIRRADRVELQARELAARYGVAVSVQGDPRGSALHIKTPKTQRYNTLGGAESGWAL